MKVAVINNTAAGKATEVHAANCADVPKAAKRNRDEAWVFEAESRVGVSMEYWADIIGDTVEDVDGPEGWATAEAWLGEFNFLPCCKDLPADHRGDLEVVTLDGEEATVTVEATPAATTVTTWIGKAIAAQVTGVYPKTHPVVLKLNEAKVTKAGDRTVKLTTTEAEFLREVCTELEGKGGSLAYSARTLRARLA